MAIKDGDKNPEVSQASRIEVVGCPPDGRLIGATASDKIGFHGASPIAQASVAVTYTARTGALGGTANGSYVDEGSLSTSNTYSDAAVNAVLAKIKDNLAEANAMIAQLAVDNAALKAALVNKGLVG